jgi:hypothetical protein
MRKQREGFELLKVIEIAMGFNSNDADLGAHTLKCVLPSKEV